MEGWEVGGVEGGVKKGLFIFFVVVFGLGWVGRRPGVFVSFFFFLFFLFLPLF